MLRQARGIGEQQHARPHAGGVSGEIAAHRLDIVDHDPGMIEQAFTRRGQFDAAPPTLEQRDAERRLQPLDPLAGGRQRQVRARRAERDAARIRDRDEELQVDQVETHLNRASLCLRNIRRLSP